MARDNGKYPLVRILAAAERASSLDMSMLASLSKNLSDPDSAVRYWAALGYLMRGREGVQKGLQELRTAMKDDSPYVRMVTAQALAQYGDVDDLSPALKVLGELAPTDKNGVFVSMDALMAVQALGKKALPLLEAVRTMRMDGPSPDARFNSYVPRLVADITRDLGGEARQAPAAKVKGKAKAKAKANP
jgi:HEAT repeat protein